MDYITLYLLPARNGSAYDPIEWRCGACGNAMVSDDISEHIKGKHYQNTWAQKTAPMAQWSEVTND